MVKSRDFESIAEINKEANTFGALTSYVRSVFSLLAVCVFSNPVTLGLIKIGFIREREKNNLKF